MGIWSTHNATIMLPAVGFAQITWIIVQCFVQCLYVNECEGSYVPIVTLIELINL